LESLEFRDSASYNSEVGEPQPHAKLVIYHEAVESSVGSLRAKIAQQVNIIGKCKFLANSRSLNWANKASFREELLGSVGSKKIATPENSAKLCHDFTDQLVHS
jgi:hypothetical protein